MAAHKGTCHLCQAMLLNSPSEYFPLAKMNVGKGKESVCDGSELYTIHTIWPQSCKHSFIGCQHDVILQYHFTGTKPAKTCSTMEVPLCMELCKNEYWGFSPEILSNNIVAEWEIPTVTFKNLLESLSKSQGCYSSKRIPTFNRNIQQVHIAVMVRCPQTFNHILELSEVKIWYARKYGIFMAWHPENSWENNFLIHIEQ